MTAGREDSDRTERDFPAINRRKWRERNVNLERIKRYWKMKNSSRERKRERRQK